MRWDEMNFVSKITHKKYGLNAKPEFCMKKQLARSKIDSQFLKLLSFIFVSFPSIHPYSLHAKFLILLAKSCFPSILIDPESMGFSTNEQYQNIQILVGKLFTLFTRTISGSYTISCQEDRQIYLMPKL